MAGIGFQLRQLSDGDNLLAPVASIGHAAVIATGPWIFTVAALELISVFASPYISTEVLEGFRLIIIYAFALSLVVTAPVVIVAARMLGDAIYMRKYSRIKPLFVAALLMSGCGASTFALCLFVAVFGLPLGAAMAGAGCCGLVALIWVALSFCGAVRDYTGISIGFAAGLGVAVVATVGAATIELNVPKLVWAFSLGLTIVFSTLCSRVFATFPQPMFEIIQPLQAMYWGILRFWRLAAGGLLSGLAIWIDKWVIWIGPTGERHPIGLLHAPLYDSAMFTACLVIIPALSLFVTHMETTFFEKYVNYYGAIRNHATLRQIDDFAAALSQTTIRTLVNIVLIQAALCSIAVLMAPSIVETAGLQYQQIGILRLGILGALFQFVFYASCSLMLFFERHRQFMLLQSVFLVLQAVSTEVTVKLGVGYYGFGNLITCVTSGLLAVAALDHTLKNLTYITFLTDKRERTDTLELQLSKLD